MSEAYQSRLSKLLKAFGLVRSEDRGGSAGRIVVFIPREDGSEEVIGELRREGGTYIFTYDDAYVRNPRSTPIRAFPDMRKEYRHTELWPFFEVRIPALDRPEVKQLLIAHQIDPGDKMAVLRVLGRRTITNPYELRPAMT